jgi:hypothetical protein
MPPSVRRCRCLLLWILVLLSTDMLQPQAQCDAALRSEQEEKEGYETRAENQNGQDNNNMREEEEEEEFEELDDSWDEEEDDDDEESPDEEESDVDEEEWDDDDEEEWDEDELWQEGNIWDFHAHLECFGGPWQPPVFHSETAWQFLRDTYREAIEAEGSTPRTFPSSSNNNQRKNGFHVPILFHIVDEDIGRGIFAKAFIPKGTLIWKSVYAAEFQSAQEYRQFLSRLPAYLACEILQWAYTTRNSDGKHVICVDLDEGSLFNAALGDDELVVEDYNDEIAKGCEEELHASRDILPGEELRVSYKGLELGWAPLGLLPYLEQEEV